MSADWLERRILVFFGSATEWRESARSGPDAPRKMEIQSKLAESRLLLATGLSGDECMARN